jgi:hypothetical protein
MTVETNKALIRQVFEKVIPAGDPAALRDLVDPARDEHRPHVRAATDRQAGRTGRHRHLPGRGREDRGAVGRLEARPGPCALTAVPGADLLTAAQFADHVGRPT